MVTTRSSPILLTTTAIERHLQWACDFAVAGDFDLALEAVRDARALSDELVIADERELKRSPAWATGVRLASEARNDTGAGP